MDKEFCRCCHIGSDHPTNTLLDMQTSSFVFNSRRLTFFNAYHLTMGFDVEKTSECLNDKPRICQQCCMQLKRSYRFRLLCQVANKETVKIRNENSQLYVAQTPAVKLPKASDKAEASNIKVNIQTAKTGIKRIHSKNKKKSAIKQSSPPALKKAKTLQLFECSLCPNKYKQASNLSRHVKSFHEKRFFECALCPKKCARLHQLKKHLKMDHLHIGEEVCEICGESCRNKQSMINHTYKHTGVFPFVR
jgi:hypothetical protein